MSDRYLVNRRDGKILGVAAGIADYTGIDPLLVRLAMIVALLVVPPAAIVLYLATGLLAAERQF